MSDWAVTLVAVLLAVVTILLTVLAYVRWHRARLQAQRAEDALDRMTVQMVEALEEGPWAEVEIVDWGEDFAEMRWRWTVWEAFPDVWALLRDPAAVGAAVQPLMLGNAPTADQAAAAAVGWVRHHQPAEGPIAVTRTIASGEGAT